MSGVYSVDRLQRRRVIRQERAKTQARELAQAREIEKAYTQLKTTQARLVQSEKMASLGELTAGIAHEIKNPLNFINNFAEVNVELAEEIISELKNNKDNQVGEILPSIEEIALDLKVNADQISKHGKRADDIVQNMMEHAQGNTGERFEVDVNDLVDEYVSLAYHAMQSRVKGFEAILERNFDDTVGHLEMVPQEIGRVLMNLLNNAYSSVHTKANNSSRSYFPQIAVSTRRYPEKIEIRIEDNGLGIPEDIRQKILNLFLPQNQPVKVVQDWG